VHHGSDQIFFGATIVYENLRVKKLRSLLSAWMNLIRCKEKSADFSGCRADQSAWGHGDTENTGGCR
jgi:hypothetical protein